MSLLEQWLIDDNMTEQEAMRNAIIMLAEGLATVRYIIYLYNLHLSIDKQILLHLCYMSLLSYKYQDIQEKLYDQVTSVFGKTGEADGESLQTNSYRL